MYYNDYKESKGKMTEIKFIFIRNYTKDRVIKPHLHSCYELVVYLDATGECVIDGNKVINFRSNQIFLIPPQTSHGEKHTGYSKIMAIGFTTDKEVFAFNQVLQHTNMTMLNAVAAIRKEVAEKQFGYLDAIQSYLEILLYHFKRSLLPPMAEKFSIDFALRYIDEYFRTELNVNELASIAGYTPDYFRILFKEKTGKTPKKYILDKKIDYAKKLLEHSTLSITNISYECGFNYVPQFLVFFKKYAGLTPNQYRNESEAKQKREFP